MSLENYEVNARKVDESQYPWVARVVHSRTLDTPHVCTASAVSERIFITAARCIYSLKVNYTTIIYQNQRLPAIALVLPSNGTKQAFDDIGVIVVSIGYKGEWALMELFDKNRTDDGFKWFADLNLSYGPVIHKVVGYATKKGLHRIKVPERKFDLTDLDVTIGIDMCSTILTFNHKIRGFYVPCYHSCNLNEFENKHPTCKNYHGVEGGAVINMNTQKLLGVATWGSYFHNYELPVGFSVPNSDNFFRDFACAQRIRNYNRDFGTMGNFQVLCD